MNATPIMNPTNSSDDFPPNTIWPPMVVNPITRNIDQIAANEALLYPPLTFELVAATAMETMTWTTANS